MGNQDSPGKSKSKSYSLSESGNTVIQCSRSHPFILSLTITNLLITITMVTSLLRSKFMLCL